LDNDEYFGKAKLSVLLERKFGDNYSVVPYNKKLFVTVIGLVRKEQADCPLPTTLVRYQCEDKNNKWMDLKKILVRASGITLMQQIAIEFLKESAAKERAEALKAASAEVIIATVMTTTTVSTTVATPSVQSQQSTSSVVTVVAAATTRLMAGQIFHDFLISTRRKKLPIHESMKNASHIAHEYTINFRVKDTIYLAPFNGGTRQELTRTINTKGRVSPRSVQRYTQLASDLVDTSLGDANVTVLDEVLKRVVSNVGPSLLKYKHGRQLIVTSP
jgi:hypothetical protein